MTLKEEIQRMKAQMDTMTTAYVDLRNEAHVLTHMLYEQNVNTLRVLQDAMACMQYMSSFIGIDEYFEKGFQWMAKGHVIEEEFKKRLDEELE